MLSERRKRTCPKSLRFELVSSQGKRLEPQGQGCGNHYQDFARVLLCSTAANMGMCLLKDAQNIMTSRYVAKWKWIKDPTTGKMIRIVKSRLCARGFLDSQGSMVPTRDTTASRFSQILIVSLSAIFGFPLETWDVSGAFLKGFTGRPRWIKVNVHGAKRKSWDSCSARTQWVAPRAPGYTHEHACSCERYS